MSDGSPGDEKVNILLVDDRPANLISLQGVLERPDYNLVTALSGDEALKLVLRQEFAVILLDVAMPGMDGFEVASTIKERPRFRNIPIIFVTASVQRIEWIFKAYSVGAVDFLQKPLDPHAVRAKVAVFVELYRQRQQLRRHASVLRDVERRERELEIERLKLESDRRYRHLAEAIPHVVWTADGTGQVEYFNERWFEITGLGPKESLGGHWKRALHPEDVPRLESEWRRALATGQRLHVEVRLRALDGSYLWFLNRAIPEQGSHGAVMRWVGTFTDIDQEKRAHQELQAAILLRDEFMSVASHELRTPLSALQLQLQSLHGLLLKSPDGTEGKAEKKLETSLRQTERLARLIDNLLDVSRITRGALELHREEFDLAQAARDVSERFRDEASRAQCPLELVAEAPVVGRWDKLRIEQVITNLLSNALKYGQGKPVKVVISAREEMALISVEDQGIGIEPDKVDRIFDRFERAVPSRHYGGLGLGLYIARQIVQAHEGTISVESRPGEGARFTLWLPRWPADTRATPPEAHEAPTA